MDRLIPSRVVSDDEHPPVAKGLMSVDFDATLFPWGELDEDTPPFDGAVNFLREAKAQGWTIIILTSRMSPTWWRSEGWDEKVAERVCRLDVASRLERYNMPYDLITAEKIPCEYYIDDKAIEFKGNWAEIHERILGGS